MVDHLDMMMKLLRHVTSWPRDVDVKEDISRCTNYPPPPPSTRCLSFYILGITEVGRIPPPPPYPVEENQKSPVWIGVILELSFNPFLMKLSEGTKF